MDSLAWVVTLRLLHIVGGVAWVGAMVLVVWFLLPAAQSAGPEGGRFMQGVLFRHGLSRWLNIVASVTVVSGALLYYRAMSTTGGAFAGSRAGMTFGAGGLLAVTGAIIGMVVSAPVGRQLGALGARMQAAGGRPDPALSAEMQRLQRRSTLAGRANASLLVAAAAAMAVARYV